MTTIKKHTLKTSLPTSEKVAVYLRSAAKPISSSSKLHEQELMQHAYNLGWTDDTLLLFTDDGRPGTTAINERPGLQALVDRIKHDEVKAVIVKSEYTLFRNAVMAEANTFIHLCQEHNVIVITPEVIYDFTSIAQVHLFCFVLEQTARERVAISARMNKAKRRTTSQHHL